MDVKSTWIPTWHRMDHASWSLGLFLKTTSWRHAQYKIGRSWHSEHSWPLIYSILTCVRTRMNRHSLKWHVVEGRTTYDFTLHLRLRDTTTWFWRCVGTAFNLDTFFWALTISWSRLLTHMWSGPKLTPNYLTTLLDILFLTLLPGPSIPPHKHLEELWLEELDLFPGALHLWTLN